MKNGNDFGGLNWIKGSLDQIIHKARLALEEYVENEGANESLDECADYLHQIAGVLQMAQVYGPSMLAEEMESVVRAMALDRVRQFDDAAEALMLALIQLPDYLEQIQSGDADIPLLILPLLNDLRSVRDAPLLSEVALFRPKVEQDFVDGRVDGKPNGSLSTVVKGLRQKYHVALIRWYRKQENETAWQQLLKVFDTLQAHAGTSQVYRFAWISGALVRGLIEQSIQPSIAIKQLFGRMDRQLKYIIESGEGESANHESDDLLKNLLYYIAQADSANEQILEIKKTYHLDVVLPTKSELDQGRQGLSGSNAELAASVSDAVQIEMTRIKDVLDLFMRNGEAEADMLVHLEKPLRQLADTFGMIGQGSLRSRLLRQVERVKSFTTRQEPPEEYELMEMAGDILFVESSLGTLHHQQSPAQNDAAEGGNWSKKLPEGEYRSLIKQTVREAKLDIAKTKDTIISYTDDPEDASVLHDVYDRFGRVCGALKVLEYSDVARILEEAADFLRSHVIEDMHVPTRQQFNALADVISSIEYFLEALVDGTGDRLEIVAIAQSALEDLQNSEAASEFIKSGAQVISLKHHEEDVQEDREIAEASEKTPQDLAQSDSHTVGKDEAEEEENVSLQSPSNRLLEDIDPEILEIFIEEAKEELETIRQYLPLWQNNPENTDALISFRRSFHTLKGSGRLVGANAIGEMAWSIENMLNRVIDGTVKPSSEMLSFLDETVEALPILIDCQEHAAVPDVDIDRLIQHAFALADGAIPSPEGEQPENESKPVETIASSSRDERASDSNQNESVRQDTQIFDVETGSERERAEESEKSGERKFGSSKPSIETTTRTDSLDIHQDGPENAYLIEIDTELLKVFAEESENHLRVLEDFVHEAKSNNTDLLITEDLTRACHTLHGSARMTGITPIANLSKTVENYLKTLAEKRSPVDQSVTGLVEDSISYIRQYLYWLYDDTMPEPDADSYLTRLAAAHDDAREATTASETLGDDEDASSDVGETAQMVVEALERTDGESERVESKMAGESGEDLFELDVERELLEIFKQEAKELLEGIDNNYQAWCNDREHAEAADAILKSLHTLKGSARLAGVTPVGELCHALESIISGLRTSQIADSTKVSEAIEHSLRVLSSQLEAVETRGKLHWAKEQVSVLDAVLKASNEVNSRSTDDSSTEISPDVEQATPIIDSEGEASLTPDDLTEPFSSNQVDTHDDGEVVPRMVSEEHLFEVGDDPELLEIFLEEAKDLLESLESDYHEWISDAQDAQHLSQIKRHLHTLKGSARLAGVMPVGDLSHAIETVFIDLVDGRKTPSETVINVTRQAFDRLANQIEETETNGKLHRADDMIATLQTIGHEASAGSASIPEKDDGAETSISGPAAEVQSTGEDTGTLNISAEEDKAGIGEDPELVEIFMEEAKEIMERLENGLQNWSNDQSDLALIDVLQRSLHTLKGSARLAGITPIGDLSHAFESLLTALSKRDLEIDEIVMTVCRQAMDQLATQIDQIGTSGKVSASPDIVARLVNLLKGDEQEGGTVSAAPAEAQTSTQSVDIEQPAEKTETAVVVPFVSEVAKQATLKKQENTTSFKPTKDQVRITADLMDRLVNNAGEVSIYRARLEQQNNILGFNLAELHQTISRLFTQLRNLEIETEAQILYRWDRDNESNDREQAEFDPLELDRFSTMQQLSRALAETVNDLGSIYDALADLQRETDTLLLQQSRISTDLQDGLLRTRMVPFSQLVPRMQRLVRQTADQLKKKAQLEVFGGEGELDRNILNRMVPVLEHLLRNAVSHGIEFPEERELADKQAVGYITLSVDREATDVLITLTDDGKGLDTEAIRNQAIRHGMIKQDAEVSDDDLIQCVLNPGFSTAKEVTQISGRGVGLDVVASEIKQLSGNLDIDSKPGHGTRFTIRLPLTLAITDALLVRVADEVFAIPHGGVEGVVRIRYEELQACLGDERRAYRYADTNYKTLYLGSVMGIENGETSDNVKWFPLLLVHTGDHHVALQVDELLGTRQIVVKSVGKQIGSVRWITGGTILADGRVALILDVGALVRMDAARSSAPVHSIETVAPRVNEQRIRVMVVDDSITVRKVTGRLLERHDMDVVTAKDGVEAVALLQEQLPDIMLLDIEMPRMDGFEVARHVNNSVDYYGLPIIMITSRVGEKHRERAFQLGVKRCLGKPYQEAELLDNIREVLEEPKV